MSEKMYKSNNDKAFIGVCGGIAKFFGFNSRLVRILFIIFFGVTIWVYIVLSFLMPSNDMIY